MAVREIQGPLAELMAPRCPPTSSAESRMRCLMRSVNGKARHSVAFTRSSLLMRYASNPRQRPVKNKAVYVAPALNSDGEKSALGLWIEQSEGAKFWLKVVKLKACGVNDIRIAVVDGLHGLSPGDHLGVPQTIVQTCIVHLIRNSLAFVSWKDRKAILPGIKANGLF